MYSKLLTATAAVTLIAGAGFAGTAHATAFEGPMANSSPYGGAEVLGSEGKFDFDGEYKVELNTGSPDTTYHICIKFGSEPPFWLTNATSDESGELKAEGSLFDSPSINESPINILSPRFVVQEPSGESVDDQDCDDGARFQTGVTVDDQ